MSIVWTKAFAYDFEVGGIYYGYDTNTQSAYVTSGDNKYSGAVNIPMSVFYNGRTLEVKEVGYRAFFECKDLVSVNLPQSIICINNGAFSRCWALTSINLPDNITEIKAEAFSYCSSLTSIILPDNLTRLDGRAFEGCEKLESINIPKNIKEIWDETFKDCKSLSSIVIPENVDKLGYRAFENCSGVKTIIIEDCERGITCDAGVLYNQYDAFWGISPQSIYIGRNIPSQLFYGHEGESGSGINYSNISTLGIGHQVKYAEIVNMHLWPSLKNIYSFSVEPESVEIAFGTKALTNAKLYVPLGTKSKYLAAKAWKDFFQIEEMDVEKMWHGEGDPNNNNTPNQKCEKPTIAYSNGKITYNCGTEGAICHSTITDTDIKSYSGNEIQLSVTYNINVYATKEGYEKSETATATLCWIDVAPKTEGITNGVATVRAMSAMIQNSDGQLTISGVDDGTPINVYNINGIQEGSSISRNGSAMVNTKLAVGSIAIVKIGEKSIKVVLK